MSCVARALPAKRVSTKPARIEGDERGHRAGVDDARAGDPQQPLARVACLAHAVGDLAHEDGLRLLVRRRRRRRVRRRRPTDSGLGTDTWMPDAPTTMRMPGSTSDIGTVRTRRPPSAASATTSPQSISGFSTSYQLPSTRTRVSRLVVE